MVKAKKKRTEEPTSADTATKGREDSQGFGSVSDVLLQGKTTEKDTKKLSNVFSKLFADGNGGLFPSSVEAPKEGKAKEVEPRAKKSRAAAEGVEVSAADTTAAEGNESASSSAASSKKKRKMLDQGELKEREERTLYVGNVPLNWDVKKLRSAIREAVGDKYDGPLKPIWFRDAPLEGKWNWSDKMRKAGSIMKAYSKESDSKSAYVVLGKPEDVALVSKLVNNSQADDSHTLRADGVGEKAVMKKFDRKRSVFIGNLPQRATEAEIRQALAPAGTVDAVRLVRDKASKECKGFAFVRFQDRWSVKEALSLWAKVQGRDLRIMKVQDENKPGGKGKGKGSDDPGSHPALRRKQLRTAARQRQKATKQKEFAKAAKQAGLRQGGGKKKKNKDRKKALKTGKSRKR